MSSSTDAVPPTYEELVALVQQLRQRLAARDQQIELLKHQLTEAQGTAEPTPADQQTPSAFQQGPLPGSREDLLAQLEQLYPEGR